DGYAAFSYSKNQLTDVYNYVANQEQHHGVISFRKEYIDTLTEAGIDFDNRFLFNFINDVEST
ncbi:MAG TPA: transposase, partial [Bacteroidales bacterium]|nr:transposase [Bacteroidales bacterium]